MAKAKSVADRAAGALVGHAVGAAAAAPDAPRADLALALLLAEELLGGRPDLRRLAGRWAAWADGGGEGLDPWTRTALGELRTHGAPPVRAPAAGVGALAQCVPIGLACAGSPQNLVSGTYHIASLTHPDPRSAWGAVAVNVALAQFVQGKRDFVAETIAALRDNQAPEPLLAVARRVPVARRDELPAPGGTMDAVAAVEIACWLAYHEPQPERGLEWLRATGAPASLGAIAGTLLGARDGETSLPAGAVGSITEAPHLRAIAAALVGAS